MKPIKCVFWSRSLLGATEVQSHWGPQEDIQIMSRRSFLTSKEARIFFCVTLWLSASDNTPRHF